MSKYIIGIDPGKNGAIALLSNDGSILETFVMPSIANELDTNELNNIIKSRDAESIECVYIEKVHALFGSSASSTFTFGRVCGIIEGVVVANGLKYIMVEPKVWQKELFQGIPEKRKPSKINKKGIEIKGRLDTKAMAEIACSRLFPNEKFTASEKSKKYHDGKGDAVLIGEYGRRKLHNKV